MCSQDENCKVILWKPYSIRNISYSSRQRKRLFKIYTFLHSWCFVQYKNGKERRGNKLEEFTAFLLSSYLAPISLNCQSAFLTFLLVFFLCVAVKADGIVKVEPNKTIAKKRVSPPVCLIYEKRSLTCQMAWGWPAAPTDDLLRTKSVKIQRPNSWTKSRQQSSEFTSLLLTVISTALPWDFYFIKLTQPLTVSVKEKGGKPDRKPYPLYYMVRKSKQKPQVWELSRLCPC
jgi:hypothetical protein